MTSEQAMQEAEAFLSSKSSDVSKLSDEELIRNLPDEVLLQHIQSSSDQPSFKQSHPLASTPAWQTLVTRPAAQYRGFVRGMAPGGENPIEGFRRGSVAEGEELVQRAQPFNIQRPMIEKYYQGVAKRHPGQDPNLMDVLGGFGVSAAGLGAETAANVATNPIESLAALLPARFGSVMRATPAGQATERFLTQKRHIFQPRLETVDEVMRVPQARLPKLTQRERDAYFRERSNQVQQAFQQQGRALKDQRSVLTTELGKSATDRSLYVREKLPKLYSDQSTHYRALVDRELAPVANDVVTDAQIRSFLTRRFASNPDRLNAVSGKLGLLNESPQQAVGLPPPTYKLGELYQKALDFGQQLPRSVRESLRTYSAADDITDDAISSLVDLLDEQGVHLREARGFWKSWAPIRNQATREFRPFIEPDVATGAGSHRLIRLAKGMDPDNEVYAKTLSELLGIDDLPGELKSVVRKLETNQKSQLAMTLQQKEATGELKAMQFQVNQIADRSARRWHKIKWVAGVLAAGSGVSGTISALRQR